MSSGILDRHGIGGESKQHILNLVANHMKSHVATQMRPAKLEKFINMPKFEDHLKLHRLDAIGSSGDLTNYHLMKSKLAAKKG